MNIANKLTLFRIFLVPIFIMSILILGIDNILGFLIFIIAETIKKFEIILQNVLAKNARDVQKCASQILVNIQNIFLNPQN